MSTPGLKPRFCEAAGLQASDEVARMPTEPTANLAGSVEHDWRTSRNRECKQLGSRATFVGVVFMWLRGTGDEHSEDN
jgi:hypothetical protein